MKNQTRTVTEFILLGFSVAKTVEPLLVSSFCITYTIALFGNLVIITLVWYDHSLHSPMYIFIANLSFLEMLYTTTVIPKILDTFINQRRSISFHNCILQAYFYFSAGSTEFFLLAVMSFDRYIAICSPLRYTAIMNTPFCTKLLTASWMCGYSVVIPPTISLALLPFCGPNTINHFFCDVKPLFQLACMDTSYIETINFVWSAFLILGSLLVTGISYLLIIATVIQIPSAKGRQKAFSTCASHLAVVILFYGSCIFIYVQPQKSHSLNLNKLASIMNTVITPLLNPFIYSLRNKKVKEALKHLIRKKISFLISFIN